MSAPKRCWNRSACSAAATPLAGLLTYAEQRALEIGITIAGGADVILLDEPTAGMSRSESDAAVELIRKVTVGKTLLMVEHDMSVVFGLADRIAVVVYGEVIACDTPANIRANAKVQEAYLGGHAPAEACSMTALLEIKDLHALLRQEPCAARRRPAGRPRAKSSACWGATASGARPRSRRRWAGPGDRLGHASRARK